MDQSHRLQIRGDGRLFEEVLCEVPWRDSHNIVLLDSVTLEDGHDEDGESAYALFHMTYHHEVGLDVSESSATQVGGAYDELFTIHANNNSYEALVDSLTSVRWLGWRCAGVRLCDVNWDGVSSLRLHAARAEPRHLAFSQSIPTCRAVWADMPGYVEHVTLDFGCPGDARAPRTMEQEVADLETCITAATALPESVKQLSLHNLSRVVRHWVEWVDRSWGARRAVEVDLLSRRFVGVHCRRDISVV